MANNYADLPEVVYVQNLLTSINRDSAKNSGPFALFDKKIAERTSNGITNAVHLNAYDSINLIDQLIREKLSNAGSLGKQREEIAKAIWATTSYKAARGTIFADGKTGSLRRDYNRMAVVTNGKTAILTP